MFDIKDNISNVEIIHGINIINISINNDIIGLHSMS